MWRVFSLGSLAASSALFWTSHVCAATFSLEFEAPPGCPSKPSLIGQVQARTALAEPVETASAIRFDVKLTHQAKGTVLGLLITRLPNSKSSTRSLDGDTCEEVVSALAVIIALTIDPGAQSGPIEPQSPTTAPPLAGVAPPVTEVAQPMASPPPEAPRPPAAPLRRPAALAPARTVVATPPQTQSKEPSTDLGQLTAGVQGDWTSLLAPRFGMLRTGAHLTFHSRSGLLATVAATWGPTTQRSDGKGAEAKLRYLGGAVELGWRTLTFDSFTLDALAVLSAGRLHAEGLPGGRIAVSAERSATWLGAGPGLELRQKSAWGGWALGANVPFGLILPSFSVQKSDGSSEEFFQVPPLGLELRLRLFIRVFG